MEVFQANGRDRFRFFTNSRGSVTTMAMDSMTSNLDDEEYLTDMADTLPLTLLRITETELEFLLAHPPLELSPGQILRISRRAGEDILPPLYAEVNALRFDEKNSGAVRVKADVLYGAADLAVHAVAILRKEQVSDELTYLMGKAQFPFHLMNHCVGDLGRLDALTVIDGTSFTDKYHALVEMIGAIQPYQRLLLIDPLGVFSSLSDLGEITVLEAGHDISLSLQKMGISCFLTCLSQELPEAIRHDALQLLARQLPMTPDFVPFRYLLNPDRYEDVAAKSPLLHVLYDLYKHQVFADKDAKSLSLSHLLKARVSCLNVSGLNQPWKAVFYREICRELVQAQDEDVIPVLIYPEHYLYDLTDWVNAFDEANLNVIMLLGRSPSPEVADLADNVIWSDSEGILVKGEMTLGLPVYVSHPALGHEEDAHNVEVNDEDDFELDDDEDPVFQQFIVADDEPETQLSAYPNLDDSDEPVEIQTLANKEVMTDAQYASHLSTEEDWAHEPTPPAQSYEPPRTYSSTEGMMGSQMGSQIGSHTDSDMESDWQEPSWQPPADLSASETSVASDVELDVIYPGRAQSGQTADDNASWDKDFDSDFDFALDEELEVNYQQAQPVATSTAPAESFDDDFAFDDPEDAWPQPTGGSPSKTVTVTDQVPVYQTQSIEKQQAAQALGLAEGDRVTHPKYGPGVVQKVIPMEGRVAVKVHFDSLGSSSILDSATSGLERLA